jgi:hypothetical protein
LGGEYVTPRMSRWPTLFLALAASFGFVVALFYLGLGESGANNTAQAALALGGVIAAWLGHIWREQGHMDHAIGAIAIAVGLFAAWGVVVANWG